MNKASVEAFANIAIRRSYIFFFNSNRQIKDYNVRTGGKNVFNQSINNRTRTYDTIVKITYGQGHDYTNFCLLDYSYFKDGHRIIEIDLTTQQPLSMKAL